MHSPTGIVPKLSPLNATDLLPVEDLVTLFERVDEVLSHAGHSKDQRDAVTLKLLLAKIVDERTVRLRDGRMIFQDFSAADYSDDEVFGNFVRALQGALTMYPQIVPRGVSEEMRCSAQALRKISQILAPVDVLRSPPNVLQEFFRCFAPRIIPHDLFEEFVPYDVADFVARILNPGAGDRVIDPCCTTSDFLAAARRVAFERRRVDIATELTGMAASETAACRSRLNLLLHSAPDAQIYRCDSLADLHTYECRYSIAVSYLPAGAQVVEERPEVLKQFELGTEDERGQHAPLKSQETGLLMAEACLRAVIPGGRIGLILPDRYLGDPSPRYENFRRWFLCCTRIPIVVGLPQIALNRSAADTAVSLIVAERRRRRLSNVCGTNSYPTYLKRLERLGWDLGGAEPNRLYKLDPCSGSLLRDGTGKLIPDSDIADLLRAIDTSPALLEAFPWLERGPRRRGPNFDITPDEAVRSLLRF
ncbi:MAG: N-6 DNA methylase [Gammaproteobacteria bacterium]